MEGKMKSKIEKIVSNINHLELNEITNKINEIIDYLNTQPQAGEYPQKAKYISGEVPEEKKTLVQLRRVFDKKRVKEWDRIAMETYKQATQDTPGKELTDKKKGVDRGVDREDTPEEWERLRRDGALAFYIELEDWLYGKGYAKDGEIKVPTEVFMRFVAKELKLNSKKK